MSTKFTIHKARNGDCILVRTFDSGGNEYNILIDGGPTPTYDEALRDALAELKDIHLLILTHIDSDHIGGLLKFLKSQAFERITVHRYWFNAHNLLNISLGTDISFQQAKEMEQWLIQLGESPEKYSDIVCFENEIYQLAPGINAIILSPTQQILDNLFSKWPELEARLLISSDDNEISSEETGVRMPALTLKQLSQQDFSPANKIEQDIFNSSSIAFLLELTDCKLLLLGDARPEVIVNSLQAKGYNNKNNKLKADFVKIAHHGSRHNTSNQLLDMMDCTNYIISTNGGTARHKHPDRDVIARIVYHAARDLDKPIKVFFNYSLSYIESRKGPVLLPEDKNEGNWEIIDDTCKFSV